MLPPVDGIDDNILSEILLRLPPMPSSIPRASAVCKRWHEIACDPGFCHRFRRHHRRNPPPETYLKRFNMDVLDIPAVLVGVSFYWQLPDKILEFNLERQSLDVIEVPVPVYNFSVIRDEDGGLGFIYMSGYYTAELWKRNTNPDGVESWVLRKTIELETLLPLDPDEHRCITIQGYAEENNLVFLSTAIRLFMVQLQSLKFTFMERPHNFYRYFPFESVYTPETRNNGPDEFDLSEQEPE